MFEITPGTFELLIAERLEKMGYSVRITGATSARDGGIDIVAVPNSGDFSAFLLAVQVKHHMDPKCKTGRIPVDRLLSWRGSDFKMALLVTNTSFTKDALWVASRDDNKEFLRLRGFNDLGRWLQDNFWSEEGWRELPKRITVAPGITIDVPRPNFNFVSHLWPFPRTGQNNGCG
jgi:hypothetical protein